MMTLPHIRAACVVVQTLRDDWDRRAVEGQVTELADLYDHPDVLYACVAIARDLNYRAPIMLTTSPARAFNETPLSTSLSPKRLYRFSTVSLYMRILLKRHTYRRRSG